ncbi:MAG: CIA30 family protein, partial [Prochlorothrix sp.]
KVEAGKVETSRLNAELSGSGHDRVTGSSETWQTVRIPFAELRPVFRARTVADAPPFDRANITSLQVMLSKFEYDGALNPRFEPGPFRLEIESIAAYGQARAAAPSDLETGLQTGLQTGLNTGTRAAADSPAVNP